MATSDREIRCLTLAYAVVTRIRFGYSNLGCARLNVTRWLLRDEQAATCFIPGGASRRVRLLRRTPLHLFGNTYQPPGARYPYCRACRKANSDKQNARRNAERSARLRLDRERAMAQARG